MLGGGAIGKPVATSFSRATSPVALRAPLMGRVDSQMYAVVWCVGGCQLTRLVTLWAGVRLSLSALLALSLMSRSIAFAVTSWGASAVALTSAISTSGAWVSTIRSVKRCDVSLASPAFASMLQDALQLAVELRDGVHGLPRDH